MYVQYNQFNQRQNFRVPYTNVAEFCLTPSKCVSEFDDLGTAQKQLPSIFPHTKDPSRVRPNVC